MRRFFLVLFAVALVAAACGSEGVEVTDPTPSTTSAAPGGTSDVIAIVAPTDDARAEPDASAPIVELAQSFNDSGFEVLRRQEPELNTVLSPVSIGHALLMARAAADDATRASIDDALALPEGMAAHDAWNALDQLIDAANDTQTDIDGDPTPIVTIADRIWPRNELTPEQDWVDLLATHHGSDVASIDVNQPEASTDAINAWVEEATDGLIVDLLPAGFVTPMTTLVLTDAIYFKAQWQSIFGKYGTAEGNFLLLDGSTKATTFMRDLENRGARGIGNGWSAAELPYLGDDFSMLIVLPDEGRYEEIRASLSTALLDEIDSGIEPGPYELLLPKWDNDAKIDLLPWLTDIGAAPGRYPGISPDSELSGAVHAADIAVDELGTVAAAATALGFDESGPPEPELTIAADRPFFYVIRHVDSGLVLFAGQVTDPDT